MLKKNKGLLIITSIVILLPMLAGLIFYDQLPDVFNSHWGLNGKADGRMEKSLTIFLLPAILFAVHWLCILITAKAPKNYGENDKLLRLTLWMMPVLSLVISAMMYLTTAGDMENVFWLLPVLLGALFIVIGNYMPKTKQNWTMGIKIKWTLTSEENWYATHRMAGKLWVLGGVLMILSMLLPEKAMMIALPGIMMAMVLAPVVYSFLHYKKLEREGRLQESSLRENAEYLRKVKKISVPILVIILGLVAVLMFTGSIEIVWNENSFTLSATYWQDLTVSYDQIDALEYRESWQAGSKMNGFDSAKMMLGSFSNSEIGGYTSYCYRAADGCVLLTVNGRYLAVSGKDAAETMDIYNILLAKIGQ